MEMIERNTRRLETFVLNILSIMKAGETSATLSKEPCDVVQILKDASLQFPTLVGRLQLEAEDSIIIPADREALHQIFTNLISNAIKFSPEGPILIRIRKNLDHIEALVEDKGQGIPQKDLERIFEPFSQSKGNHYSSKGTGLGLAIAKRWVEAHQGKIWAESDGIGKGSRFWVTLQL
jgi:signal transduction histidine kinase